MHHNYRRKSAKHHKAKIMFRYFHKRSLRFYKNQMARDRRMADHRALRNEDWEKIRLNYPHCVAWMAG